MRSSTQRLLDACGGLLALVFVAWTALAVLLLVGGAVMGVGGEPFSAAWGWTVQRFGHWELLARTLWVTALIAGLAVLLALPAAWALRTRRGWLAPLLPAPLLLPTYLVYVALGLLRAPGTPLGDAIELANEPWLYDLVGSSQAILGLALWSWPLAAVGLGPGVSRLNEDQLDAVRLSGSSRVRRTMVVGGMLAPSLLVAWGLVLLVMLGSAVPLHVAQVETWSIVVWRGLDETWGGAGAWLAALPMVLVAAGGAWLVLRWARRAGQASNPGGAGGAEKSRWIWPALLVWLVTALGPLVVLVVSLDSLGSMVRFFEATWRPLLGTLPIAAAAAVWGLVLAAGAAVIVQPAGPRGLRAVGWLCAGLLICLTLTPGVLVGWSVVEAGQLPGMRWLAVTPAGLVLAECVRLGAVSVLVAVWVTRSEATELGQARAMLQGSGAAAWARSWGGCAWPALLGGAVAVGLLALHEIEAAVLVAPPGRATFAEHMLRLLHYLREEELKVAAMWILLLGLAGSVLVMGLVNMGWRRRFRFGSAAGLVMALLVLVVVGCERDGGQARGPRALPVEDIWGGVGQEPGEFLKPRGITVCGERIFIVDKTARVQVFTKEGEALGGWMMPAYDNGMPVGLSCGPDGLVYVPDTHEHRVMIFRVSEDGATAEVAGSFGAYGEGDGQFIFPTDVAVVPGPDGVTATRIYVSEYGGNDRISVFDGDFKFLFSFGQEGWGGNPEAIEFARPQSILWHPELESLFVADAVNHRIGRFTADGELLGWYGKPGPQAGNGLGEFRYPYGLALLPDGDLLVCELGNNRVQRLDAATGEGIALYGRPGRAEGELKGPWGIATSGWDVFVLDTGNGRVQRMRLSDGEGFLSW